MPFHLRHLTVSALSVVALAVPHLALAQARPQAQAQSQYGHAAIQGEVTQMPHISIVTIGRGSPVVLIPGLSTPRQVWAGIAPEIARNHRVLLVQVNGFGPGDPGENLRAGLLEGVVADLHGYLQRERIGPVDVMGHSLGGLVTLMMAKEHPASVRRLMIVDALPFIGELFAPGATVAQVEPQARVMRDAMAASYGTPVNRDAATAMANRMATTPQAREKVVEWMGAADPRVTAQAFYEDMTTDVRPALPAIQAPITLVYPASDAATALYRRAYTPAPRITYVPVADSAHFVMLDQPAAFADAVRAFLR